MSVDINCAYPLGFLSRRSERDERTRPPGRIFLLCYTEVMAHSIPRPLKILVIDDDQMFNRTVEARLAKEGFLPESCFDGESGLKAFDGKKFDLVVLDLVMPHMPGF